MHAHTSTALLVQECTFNPQHIAQCNVSHGRALSMAEALIHPSCQSNPDVNADIAPDDEVRPQLCSDASGSNLTLADEPAEGQHVRGGRGLICNTSIGSSTLPCV